MQAFGFPYTPMHSILPFLLLGIGIDDMFVIVQSFTIIQVCTILTELIGMIINDNVNLRIRIN